MKCYVKSATLTLSLVALLMASVGLAAAQQGGSWKKERIYDGLVQATANTLAGEINSGSRGGYLKNAVVVADGRPGMFAVEADRFNEAETPASKSLSGTLSAPAADKRDIQRFTQQLTPGARYVIELTSGSGGTNDGKALPGFFDPVLLVENGQGTQLAFNDDINWPTNCNSRVTITVPQVCRPTHIRAGSP